MSLSQMSISKTTECVRYADPRVRSQGECNISFVLHIDYLDSVVMPRIQAIPAGWLWFRGTARSVPIGFALARSADPPLRTSVSCDPSDELMDLPRSPPVDSRVKYPKVHRTSV